MAEGTRQERIERYKRDDRRLRIKAVSFVVMVVIPVWFAFHWWRSYRAEQARYQVPRNICPESVDQFVFHGTDHSFLVRGDGKFCFGPVYNVSGWRSWRIGSGTGNEAHFANYPEQPDGHISKMYSTNTEEPLQTSRNSMFRLYVQPGEAVMVYRTDAPPLSSAAGRGAPINGVPINDPSARPKKWVETIGFRPDIICNDAIEKRIDHFSDQSTEYIDVELKPGCYGPLMVYPRNWRAWLYQPAVEGANGWVSMFKVVNTDAHVEPTRFEDLHYKDYEASCCGDDVQRHAFRFQGSGKMRVVRLEH